MTLERSHRAAELALDSERLVGTRLRLACTLWVAFIGISHLVEGNLHRDRATALLLSFGVALVCMAAALATTRRDPRHAVAAAVLLTAALQFDLGLINAYFDGDAHVLTIAFICQIGLSPVVLLWDERAQLATSVSGALAFLVAVVGGARTPSLAYDVIALAAASVGSIAGARTLANYRARLLAEQASLADERDRAHAASRALTRRSDFLSAIQELIAYAADPPPLVHVLDRVLTALLAVLDRSAGAIHLLAGDTNTLELRAAKGFPSILPDAAQRVDDRRSVLWRAIERQEVTRIDTRSSDLPLAGSVALRETVVVPITSARGTLGTIAVLDRDERALDGDELQLLALMAGQLGVVLEQTSLVEENRRRLDLLDRQETELARVAQVKTDLLNTISHEMRTPVHILLSYVDILLEELRHDTKGDVVLSAEAGELIPRMRRRARELSDLVDGTLDLSRLESGRLPVTRQPFDVPLLVEEVRDAASDLIRGGTVEIRIELGEIDVVETDRVKVRHILRNLVTNAIKFTHSGSVTIAAAREGADLLMRVRDTGVGIPPDHLGAIFDAFHQIGDGPIRGTPGFGLGLHLVKRLVDLLGGSIAVESTVGRGSEFTVRLPGVVVPPAAVDPNRSGSRDDSGATPDPERGTARDPTS